MSDGIICLARDFDKLFLLKDVLVKCVPNNEQVTLF